MRLRLLLPPPLPRRTGEVLFRMPDATDVSPGPSPPTESLAGRATEAETRPLLNGPRRLTIWCIRGFLFASQRHSAEDVSSFSMSGLPEPRRLRRRGGGGGRWGTVSLPLSPPRVVRITRGQSYERPNPERGASSMAPHRHCVI